MILFEFEEDSGDTRNVFWLGCTTITDIDKFEADSIYEQLMAHEIYLDA